MMFSRLRQTAAGSIVSKGRMHIIGLRVACEPLPVVINWLDQVRRA